MPPLWLLPDTEAERLAKEKRKKQKVERATFQRLRAKRNKKGKSR